MKIETSYEGGSFDEVGRYWAVIDDGRVSRTGITERQAVRKAMRRLRHVERHARRHHG